MSSHVTTHNNNKSVNLQLHTVYHSIHMKPHPLHTTNHLRDLTPQEAQQLTAFIDKRKWFEHRLDVSSYYFLHNAYTSLSSPSSTSLLSIPLFTQCWNKYREMPTNVTCNLCVAAKQILNGSCPIKTK